MQLKEGGQMLKQVLLVSSSNTHGSAGALVSHTGKSQSYAVLPKHVLASPFPAPAHVICSPSSFARLLFLLKPPKKERQLQALSFASRHSTSSDAAETTEKLEQPGLPGSLSPPVPCQQLCALAGR